MPLNKETKPSTSIYILVNQFMYVHYHNTAKSVL